ncbi:ABC transporter ATP-binding protein [Neptunomonas antarctica]|uniref:Spermidine/putrescine import ATP-binding protein PotA n=1 Tax=Neptunomonas antarctica TaxID=619304 RepID=A0A1N7J579_9GAMM|nr:ABC transporter ATP-binding protein [Neptunomonas antarctica]SIS44490.1 putative spermidine/putrescine transport system ATP-binding protein [Neptunomonas antarctica]
MTDAPPAGNSPTTNDQYVRFVNVKKSYDQRNLVVKDFNLDIKKGEFVTLLGPSGSGKTTCLMMLAGFEDVTSGSILINGEPVTNIAPYHRNIGMVFQHYALFPHMTIAENLAYPLKVRKISASEIKRRVNESLALVELGSFAKRYPGQLSGGQKQRVALARSLIFEPSIVLMDEPLGALDKNLREQMQFEIKRLHEDLGFTAIYVTHDQTEALTMSDRVAVFNDGIVEQCAAPEILYEKPANSFVANFIGENNRIPGTVTRIENGIAQVQLADGTIATTGNTNCPPEGSPCTLTIRPENLFIASTISSNDALDNRSLENSIEASFTTRLYVGDSIRYFFKLSSGSELMVKTLNDHRAPVLQRGAMTRLTWSTAGGLALDRSE